MRPSPAVARLAVARSLREDLRRPAPHRVRTPFLLRSLVAARTSASQRTFFCTSGSRHFALASAVSWSPPPPSASAAERCGKQAVRSA
jgi:hypothetical protein